MHATLTCLLLEMVFLFFLNNGLLFLLLLLFKFEEVWGGGGTASIKINIVSTLCVYYWCFGFLNNNLLLLFKCERGNPLLPHGLSLSS